MKTHQIIVKYDEETNKPIYGKRFRKGEVVEGQMLNKMNGKMMRKAKHLAGKKYGIHF